MEITDAEEEFKLQLELFCRKITFFQGDFEETFTYFNKHWPKFLDSIPPLTAKNYPSTERAIRHLFMQVPQSSHLVLVFLEKLIDFLNSPVFDRDFKSELRRRQQASNTMHLHQKISAIEAKTGRKLVSTRHKNELGEERLRCPCGFTQKADGSKLNLCSGCKVQPYCGRECQRTDWPRHKPECEALSAEAKSMFTGLKNKKERCVCGRTTKLDGTPLFTCSRCRVQHYCSAACQREDWPRHKLECK
jgi:hypothetical protein